MLDVPKFKKIVITKCSHRELIEKVVGFPGTDG